MNLTRENLEELTEDIIKWIRESMENSGGKKAVIGISGGKDSSVVAGLAVRALGADKVVGILMPDGVQSDISYAEDLCDFLGIQSTIINIKSITSAFLGEIEKVDEDIVQGISRQTRLNLPPRVRMTVLYAVSQSIEDARVINTSNLSEDWIGYATLYGDTAGAFSPLGMLTSDEVIQIGEYLGLPQALILKVPSDGLTGETDEDIFGFSYEVLNKYIRQGIIDDLEIKEKIDRMHRLSRHKFLTIPMYKPSLDIVAEDIANIYG